MKTIGITGNSGSGKTAVCAILARQGGCIIDADYISRLIVEPGKPAYNELVGCFGNGILNADKTLDRRGLARLAFADEHRRRALIDITHKYILQEMDAQADRARSQPDRWRFIVLDAPLLIEAGLHEKADEVWVVYAGRETLLRRITARDGISRQDAEARLAAQPSLETLSRHATRLIENNGDPAALEASVLRLIEQDRL